MKINDKRNMSYDYEPLIFDRTVGDRGSKLSCKKT